MLPIQRASGLPVFREILSLIVPGGAGTGMTGRWGVRYGRRRRQRCALMKAKQRVPSTRGRQPGDCHCRAILELGGGSV
jgi:hypothetical protein